jgi:hypothetical protein
MRKFLVMLAVASAVILSNASAQEAGTMIPPTVPPAPVGHAQPTARSFAPDSTADEIEQRRMSTFDTQQHELDEMLDKKLNICRC